MFVLLWSSGAIFSELGLRHAAPFAFLVLRFGLALLALLIAGLGRHAWLPRRGTRLRVAATGVLLSGGYSISYLLALDHGVPPGMLATVLGIQPILTLLVLEPRASLQRLMGLVLALCGLVLVVYGGLSFRHLSISGVLFALAALGCMTSGAMLQKGIKLAPLEVLPLQYGASLLLCLVFVPFEPFHFQATMGFLVPLLWLGVVISVIAQLVFYRLIQAGNLVNVTSLFYGVPAVTAAMDYLFFGNRLPWISLIGMAAILLGVMQVYRTGAGNETVLETGTLPRRRQ